MKKRIISVILSLAFIISMGAYTSTQTWFSAGSEKHQSFKSGKIEYLVAGEFINSTANGNIEPGIINQPGSELVDINNPIVLTNRSTIDSQIRIKISCEYYDQNNVKQTYNYISNSEDSLLEVEFEDGWSTAEGSTDGFYYYGVVDTPEAIIIADSENPQQIPIFKSLKYSGENTGINNSDIPLNVKVTVQARQAYHVNWETIGVI